MRKIMMLAVSIIGLASVATATLTTGDNPASTCKTGTECCCKTAGECGGGCGMACCK